jgi:hypothetical protein
MYRTFKKDATFIIFQYFVNIKIMSRQLIFQTLAMYATILTEIKSVFNQYVSDDDDDDDDDDNNNNNINNNNLHIHKSLQRENKLRVQYRTLTYIL